MGFIKKYPREILFGLILVVLYLILRLTNLTTIPLFTDEAIYLRWAQIAVNDANWRFIALTDGKQPLFVWATMVLMKFIADPLLAGRLVSVIMGLITMAGLYVLSYELFRKKTIAFIAVILYIAFPFAQVHDRMALMDSMVVAFYVWAVYFSILLVRYTRLDVAYTLGFVIGLGTLTKSTGFYNILLLPITLLLFDIKRKKIVERFLKWALYALIAVVISQALYSMLRLSPYFHMIEQKNATFIYPISEWVKHPFTFFPGNLQGLTVWFFEYMTVFYSALVIFSLIFIKYFPREKLLLLLYFLGPFLSLALFGKVLYARYILFMSVMLLPLASWSIDFLSDYLSKRFVKTKKAGVYEFATHGIVTLLAIGYPLFVSYQFAVNPVEAKIARADSYQYVNSWNAGWAIPEIVELLGNEARDKKIFVATEGTFGLMPYGLELYLVQNKNITIKGYWPLHDTLPEEVAKSAQVIPTYFLFYQPVNKDLPSRLPLELVIEKQNGKSSDYMRLYRVLPQEQ